MFTSFRAATLFHSPPPGSGLALPDCAATRPPQHPLILTSFAQSFNSPAALIQKPETRSLWYQANDLHAIFPFFKLSPVPVVSTL